MRPDYKKGMERLELRMKELGIRTVWKDKSRLNKLFAFFLKPFNPTYMANMVTTLGSTIYWPEERWEDSEPYRRFGTQAHEVKHVLDSRKYWYLYFWSYLVPQLLALPLFLAVLAFWNPAWLLCLAFALFLIPGITGDSPRAHWELRAYKISHVVLSLRVGHADQPYADRIAGIFTGPKYLWMAASGKRIRDELMATTQAVLEGKETDDPWLNEVVRMLLDE
jgi:hypothetical protein